MRSIVAAAALGLILGTAPAWADAKPSAEEEAKIKETVAAWGCEGGQFEKETEGTGLFEANDVKCKNGLNYDLKLDKAFNPIAISVD
jgi:hypothetical protein